MRCVVKNKKGQIWVETVIYTLIGLAIIGLVLTITRPRIEEKKDELIIEQAIEALKSLDSKVKEVRSGEGNRRSVELQIGKGILLINTIDNKLVWTIESSFKFSEPGVVIPVGNLDVLTTGEDPYVVSLSVGYNFGLSYEGEAEGSKEINSAPNPYTLLIENVGRDPVTNELTIDISLA